MNPRPANPAVHEGLVSAARDLFLSKGLAATSVAEICDRAQLTKGAFFHYFATKDAIAKAVLEEWVRQGGEAFQEAAFMRLEEPLDRLLGYVDFTIELSRVGPLGCMVGAFTQELWETHPEIRAMCGSVFADWADGLKQLLDAAKAHHRPGADIDTGGLAYHFIAVFEGAVILGRAGRGKAAIETHLEHYKRYLRCVFGAAR